MLPWQKHMEHSRASRNALAICNGVSPDSFKDTDGSIQTYNPKAYIFDGKIYWAYMSERGHDSAEFQQCKCSR